MSIGIIIILFLEINMNVRTEATGSDLKQLKSLRLKAGWTQEYVANNVLFVSPRTYRRWEGLEGNMKRIIFETFEQKVNEAVSQSTE